MTTARRLAPRLMVWRSPADQPRWARPTLLFVAAVAGVAYAWRMDGVLLEPYYAAAVRSMAMSWRNFAYGAFDPAGTVTLDKLPGAFWLQALSVRLFGVHVWAIVLPQVAEGVLTVLVLYRAVRRLAGPVAGLFAATVLALSPATVALNRGNISDALMTLLLVLAADATSAALLTGRTRTIVLAGVWVGLAFQAKMLQAWLVLPALGLAYLLAAPRSLRRRAAQVGAAGLVTVLVSTAWMVVVSLTPAGARPYVDGSQHDSIFEQVFVYNGFGRVGGWSPLSLLADLGLGAGLFESPPAAWNRLLVGSYGHCAGWLLPAALICALAGLVASRREPRTNPVRACLVLWGVWLAVLAVVLSAASSGWPYYTAMLAPASAASLGVGLTCAWRARRSGWRVQALATVVVGVSVGYGAWLLPGEGTGLPAWLRPLLIAAGVAAEVLLVAAMVSDRARARLSWADLAAGAAALLVVPAVASASIVENRLGPFDTPFQPQARTASVQALLGTVPDLRRLESIRDGAPNLLAAQPGVVASRFIFHSGEKALPIGGFTGTMPEPSLGDLQSKVARGEFHAAILAPSGDPRYLWIASHCRLLRRANRSPMEVYTCLPADARSPPAVR